MAMWSRYSFAFWMISYLAMVPDRSFWNSRWTEAVFYGVIMLVIIWKPNGLFGKQH